MQPGRELDALVAEKVMGLPVKWATDPYREIGMPEKGRQPYLKGVAGGVYYDWADVPKYSTDIAAAWAVVERFTRLNYDVALHTTREGWTCAFRGALLADAAQAPTAAHAICLAALKAVGWETPDATK